MADTEARDLLTLEPLLEAVRERVEAGGWRLSGMQKTTSYEFEGRWEGESTRSAYLFFHGEVVPEDASIDAFLDETSSGLRGNVALVVDGPDLREIGDVETFVGELGGIAAELLPEGYRSPLTVRFAVRDVREADGAGCELRFKVRLPSSAISAGQGAVHSLCETLVGRFEALLEDERLRPHLR